MPAKKSYALVILILLALFGLPPHTIQAVQPGEKVIDSQGSLIPSQQMSINVYTAGSTNLRLLVNGGQPTDIIRLKVVQGSTTLASWDVHSGEETWVSTMLQAGNQIQVLNTSGNPLSYHLIGYAEGVMPDVAQGVGVWSGKAQGSGVNSFIKLTVSTAGQYRFTLGASGGSYQIRVDNNEILKTVVTGSTPSSVDTTYYLSSGTHTFTIVQSPSAMLTTWSVSFQLRGSSNETLPVSESSSILGGGSFFNEEWIPIQLAGVQPLNIRIAATGSPSDTLRAELHTASGLVLTSTDVHGGEVIWDTTQLLTGTNKLHVTANGNNTSALSYTVTLSPIANAPFAVTGVSYGAGARKNNGNSVLAVSFPSTGLYTFTADLDSGRYQLLLDDNYIQQTVPDATGTSFSAFVSAGTHELVVVQDPASPATAWSISATPTGVATDTLPLTHGSSDLGGVGNAFTEEWLPVQITQTQLLNMRISVAGDSDDALRVELHHGGTLAHSATTVYGGEVFWMPASLGAGLNRIHVMSNAANSNPLSYTVELLPVETIPTGWGGVSNAEGLNSTVQLYAPNDGFYQITLVIEEGGGQVLIDEQQGAPKIAIDPQVTTASTTTLLVPLDEGLHTIAFEQDASWPVTRWMVNISLSSSIAQLDVTTIEPRTLEPGQGGTVIVNGIGFEPGMTIELYDAQGNLVPVSSSVISETQIELIIPSSMPVGIYDLYLSTPGGNSMTELSAVIIGNDQFVFIPLLFR